MRITNHTFTRSQTVHVKVLKKTLAEKKLNNPTMFDHQVEDVYGFILGKGQNLLSRQSIRDGIKKELGGFMGAYEQIDVRTKHMEFSEFLKRVGNLKIFKAFINEAEKYSELLIKFMFRIAEKNAQKQALEGLKNQGKLGIPKEQGLEQIDDLEGLANHNNQVATAVQTAVQDMSDFGEALPFLNDMLEGIDQDPGIAGDAHGTLKGHDSWKDRIEYLADHFDIRASVIYSLAHTLDLAIEAKHNSKEYEKTTSPEDFKNIDVEQGKDVAKATPIDQMKDDGEFFDKMAKGELNQRVYEENKSKKQCLYVLCDVSGSMAGRRANMASAVVISLCRKTSKLDDGIFFLRFFDADVFDRQDVLSKGMARKVEQYVLDQGFSGGGTRIQRALDVAIDDISKAEEEFGSQLKKAEIMLITDAEDMSVQPSLKQELDAKHIKLHTFVVNDSQGMGGGTLQQVSDTFKFVGADKNGSLSIVDSIA